ncbi:MAG TPA: hypothetical protein PKN73_02480 [Candidatus Paceibacterota bacterium]|nr:hypothetical protein [Candidatus Paceibacterota bacterium]
MKFLAFSQTKLGSSLSLPAHGWVGARATSFLAAHFAKQNTNSVGVQSEGEAEGGCGGNSASPEPKRSPAALLVQSRVPQKSFLFLLEEKIGRAQNKNCEENFFAEQRAKRAAAGRSELVGILLKMGSDFFQQTPPKLISCLARRFAPRFGRHFRKEMPRVFEINRQVSRRKAAVHKFKNLYCDFAAMSRWFSSAFGGKQNEILQIVGVKRCPFHKIKNF